MLKNLVFSAGVALAVFAAALLLVALWVGVISPHRIGLIQPAQPVVIVPKITVIHFSAPWCGPCHEQRPEYDRIRHRHKHCEFQEADADTDRDVFKENHVSRIPTYIVLADGKEFGRTMDVNQLGQWLNHQDDED